MWDLPGPGLEPVSAALAGGVLTTASPGKSPITISQTFLDPRKIFMIDEVFGEGYRNLKLN